MRGTNRVWMILKGVLTVAAIAVISPPCRAGIINFSGNLAGSSPLLMSINTPASIASGSSISEPFSASANGVGSVTGSLLLSDLGGMPSISIQNLTVTDAGSSLGFGFTVTQSFAHSGIASIDATDAASGTATFTGGSQIASFGVASSIQGSSGNPFVTLSPGLSGGAFSLASDHFPEVKTLTPGGTGSALGVPASSSVTLIFAFDSTLIGAGTSITMTPGTGMSTAASVPEPSSLIMLGLGLACAVGIRRKEWGWSRAELKV